MRLSKTTIKNIEQPAVQKPAEEMFLLPEKVLQFGTGVLSRGIPDYFINKANSQGLFKGRIVAVTSSPYDTCATALEQQDYLYTQIARGVSDGKMVEERSISAAISRVLYAKEQWSEILACASNPELQVIIADTFEVDLTPDANDNLSAQPPASFACMLLAFLYERFRQFNGDASKGFVIIPTELISQNGPRLEAILLELAHINHMEPAFMDWLENSNHFCHSLIDRVIPNHAFPYIKSRDEQLTYDDELQVVSESFCGWFIETSDNAVKEILSFSQADNGVIIADDIEVFRELKLRLLNGVHTFSCALSHLAGLETVRESMEHPAMSAYISRLMKEEIAPAIPYYIPAQQIDEYAEQVLDRFRNPYIRHSWLSICLHFSQKMKLRNVPVIVQHYQQTASVPELMALGFAAHILFMKSSQLNGRYYGNGAQKPYLVQDERAAFYAKIWASNNAANAVHAILADEKFWGLDLSVLPGFEAAVIHYTEAMQKDGILPTVEQALQLETTSLN